MKTCPQPCDHLSQEDAREGRVCAEHPCTCEPTNAQAEALFEELANGGVNWADAWAIRRNPEVRQRYTTIARLALRKALAAGGER